MSKMTTIRNERELVAFAEKAAAAFKANAKLASFGSDHPAQGEYLALRWGMDNDCVLVLKLDPDFEPVNFQQAAR